ncbi:MAG: DUF6323 family protein [Lachnospiraceae bacterium]
MKDANFLQLISEEKAALQVMETNAYTQRFGLSMTTQDAKLLVQDRKFNLKEQQRVEFGEGIMPKLIYAFCDSPFLYQDNYVETMEELQSIFYLYKNETDDLLSDDELIEKMQELFNGKCQGSLEYLKGTCLANFARKVRNSQAAKDQRHPKKILPMQAAEVQMHESMMYTQKELLAVAHMLTERYTSKESSSVPYETARRLMGAVVYTIEFYYSGAGQKNDVFALQTTEKVDAETAYERGYQKILELAAKTQEKFQKTAQQFQSFGNRAYEDVMRKGIPAFFQTYDARFAPQNTGIMLDYPVLGQDHKRQGITAIAYAVDAIALEQQFFQKIPREYCERVLRQWHPDYEELIENICLVVLQNLLCCFLIQKHPNADADETDQREIQQIFQTHTKEELQQMLEAALFKVVDTQYDGNKNLYMYLKQSAETIAVELKTAAEHGNLQI